MRVYNYQTVVITKEVPPWFYNETPIHTGASVGAIGYIQSYTADYSAYIIIPNDKNYSELDVPWDSFKPYYYKHLRPIYNSSRCKRMVDVEFKPTSIKRGREIAGPILDVIQPLGGVIAGSYAAWMTLPDYIEDGDDYFWITLRRPQDLDIFATRPANITLIRQRLSALGYDVTHDGDALITMRPGYHMGQGYPKIHIINPSIFTPDCRYSTPEDIIDTFDFTVCRALVADRSSAIVDTNLETDYAHNVLRVMKIHDPIRGMARIRKYENKGFNASRYNRYLYFEAMRFKDINEDTMLEYGHLLQGVDENWGFEEGELDEDY